MKNQDYKSVKNSLNQFNYCQLRKLKSQINIIENKKLVAKKIDEYKNKLDCPYCNSNKYVKWGRQSDLQRYKCKECKKTFNSLTATPLANLKRKGHWIDYAKCIVAGKSIRKSAFFCGISKSTAFRWRHRFLIGTNKLMMSNLKGIIEINNLEQIKSYKGAVNIPAKIKNLNETFHILFIRDRYGNTINQIYNNYTSKELSKFLSNKLSDDTLICINKSKTLETFLKKSEFKFGSVNIENKIFTHKKIIHINNVVKYQEEFQSWMERFKGVATKYLINYLSWYRGLDQYKMNPSSLTVLMRSIS